MGEQDREAPGRPGSEPRWTSGAKAGVGTATAPDNRAASLVWFTIAQGIFNEVFFPRPDLPCIRDLGLIVTADDGFFCEEKCGTRHEIAYLADGVPAFRLTNTCKKGRFRIEKTIFAHPYNDAVLQKTRFTPLVGTLADYRLYALLAPHLGGQGMGNTAWIADCKGTPMLFARRDQFALALACSPNWTNASAGFVGVSDGWQELHRHQRLKHTYDRADNGNVALTGEIDLQACGGEFLLALAFGGDPAEAGLRARFALCDDFASLQDEYERGWHAWQKMLLPLESAAPGAGRLYRASTMAMRVHDGKSLTGAVASLATPWGMEAGDEGRLKIGYHLVWPRDSMEAAGGLLAVGAGADVFRRLRFLEAAQEADGHWPQNMWLTGAAYWTPIQLGQTAQPILVADLLRREARNQDGCARFWPMVRAAANFLQQAGPVTQEDRWERKSGYTPFTLATVIAALLAAAEFADLQDESDLAGQWRDTADAWNACIEGWLYVTGTDLARRAGVEGYYVRVLKPELVGDVEPGQPCVHVHGEPPVDRGVLVTELVSPDALALVRFGLRAPSDPRIRNTIKVIDAILKVDLPMGPSWHRFNGDEYGETPSGEPFPGPSKGGLGRAWPLLTGERAHYELAAGRRDIARRLLRTMESFAGDGCLLPEQVWDSADIPEHGLFLGRPTGSAMPLVWAHAEYVKLLRSLRDGRVFDMPPQTVQRYLHSDPAAVSSRREQAVPVGGA